MNTNQHIIRLCLAFALLLGGCAGNGYITSSVNTVLGLDVSENPKTQVPHVKFGYARSGLYYVPTGKTETKSGSTGSGDASETPTVVSEIFVHSKFLTDITISEKFAIGPGAVGSSAATQTFANNSAQAVAANGTVESRSVAPTVIIPQARPSTKTDDATVNQLKKDAEIRKTADQARADLFSALDGVISEKKNPAFFNTVMATVPANYPRTEIGLTRYAQSEKDSKKIQGLTNLVKTFTN